jgi:hypothetical protein
VDDDMFALSGVVSLKLQLIDEKVTGKWLKRVEVGGSVEFLWLCGFPRSVARLEIPAKRGGSQMRGRRQPEAPLARVPCARVSTRPADRTAHPSGSRSHVGVQGMRRVISTEQAQSHEALSSIPRLQASYQVRRGFVHPRSPVSAPASNSLTLALRLSTCGTSMRAGPTALGTSVAA